MALPLQQTILPDSESRIWKERLAPVLGVRPDAMSLYADIKLGTRADIVRYEVLVEDVVYNLRVSPALLDPHGLSLGEFPLRHDLAVLDYLMPAFGNYLPRAIAHAWADEKTSADWLLTQRPQGTRLDVIVARERNLGFTALSSLGSFLRRLHALGGSSFGPIGDAAACKSTWRKYFCSVWERVAHSFEVLIDTSLADRLRASFDIYAPIFDDINTARCTHLGLTGWNVFVDDNGALQGICDWEYACWGDPVFELTMLSVSKIDRSALRMAYGPGLLSLTVDEVRRQRFYRVLMELRLFILMALSSEAKYKQFAQMKSHVETYLLQFELMLAEGLDPLAKANSAL